MYQRRGRFDMPYTTTIRRLIRSILLPVLLKCLLVVFDVAVAWYPVRCLWDKVVWVGCLVVLLLRAEEAEGPVGKIEAAENDDGGENLI